MFCADFACRWRIFMTLTAYNQVTVPNFMYGTAWKKDATARLVELAISTGFRAIDTANQLKHYDEALVGEALQSLQPGGVGREAVFLQTKFTSLDGQDHRLPYDPSADLTTQVKQSMDSSLQHLHTDYLDSYVLHGPYSRNGLGAADWEVWAAIEDLHRAGKARIIGISNVSADQLALLCAKATVKPMVVQNRCYAITGWDHEVRKICRDHQIIYQGFSLLTANGQVAADPFVRGIAKRLETGVAQVIFRFAMQIGMLPLTGTTNPQHMKEDLAAEQLELTAEEVAQMENIAISGHSRL
jgi:diketogulonate reductase-like aldo/keto reductase